MVDATFSHLSPMSGSELRELADAMPVPVGNKALAPPVLATLPKGADGQSTHYALEENWLRAIPAALRWLVSRTAAKIIVAGHRLH